MEQRWKFLRLTEKGIIKSNSGNVSWKVGKQKTHRGDIELCESGFHCSKEIYQAFSFVQGEVLAIVECEGKHLDQDDKEVWQKMKIVKAYKWQKADSVALAIYASELVIDIYEKKYPNDERPRKAIDAAKKWLNNPTEENRAASARAAIAKKISIWMDERVRTLEEMKG